MSRILDTNPYTDVDWGTVEQHLSEFHNHSGGFGEDRWDNVADFWADNGYTVFGVSDRPTVAWPWTEFNNIYGDPTEDRDPEQMGVVSFPTVEMIDGADSQHTNGLFTEAVGGYTSDTTEGHIETAVEGDAIVGDGNGLAIFAHSSSYGPPVDVDRYAEWFEKYHEYGLIGVEAYEKASGDATWRMVDYIHTEIAPEITVWGFGADDPNTSTPGNDSLRNETMLLLHPDEFDPSNQDTSRLAAYNAFVEGRHYTRWHPSWDPDTEDKPPSPTITDITVVEAEKTITITATDADTIEWHSTRGKVVATGDTLHYGDNAAMGLFARARLRTDGGGEASTQTWAFRPSENARRTSDGNLVVGGEFDEEREDFAGVKKQRDGDYVVGGELDETADSTGIDADGNQTAENEFKED